MNVNSRMHRMVKRHEGLRLTAYRDTLDKWTIGYGHLLSDPVDIARAERGLFVAIAPESADYLFGDDVQRAVNGVKLLFANVPMNDARFAALVDMCFQLGVAGLKRFERMRRCIYTGDWKGAAREALNSRWAIQTNRRALEIAAILETGKWLPEEFALSEGQLGA